MALLYHRHGDMVDGVSEFSDSDFMQAFLLRETSRGKYRQTGMQRDRQTDRDTELKLSLKVPEQNRPRSSCADARWTLQ